MILIVIILYFFCAIFAAMLYIGAVLIAIFCGIIIGIAQICMGQKPHMVVKPPKMPQSHYSDRR
jgi:uncharacterized membrane protein YczE